MILDSFQQLEAPARYYNDNGVSFGYVVRVQSLDRSLFLNDISKIQDALMVQTPMAPNSRTFYMTTALFASEHHAYECAEAFYEKHGWEYDYEQAGAEWRVKQNAQDCLKTVESQVMEFI